MTKHVHHKIERGEIRKLDQSQMLGVIGVQTARLRTPTWPGGHAVSAALQNAAHTKNQLDLWIFGFRDLAVGVCQKKVF